MTPHLRQAVRPALGLGQCVSGRRTARLWQRAVPCGLHDELSSRDQHFHRRGARHKSLPPCPCLLFHHLFSLSFSFFPFPFSFSLSLIGGQVKGCLTPSGPTETEYHAKPIIIQGAYLAAAHESNFSQFAPFRPQMVIFKKRFLALSLTACASLRMCALARAASASGLLGPHAPASQRALRVVCSAHAVSSCPGPNS